MVKNEYDVLYGFSAKVWSYSVQTILNSFQNLYAEAGIAGASSDNDRRQFLMDLQIRSATCGYFSCQFDTSI